MDVILHFADELVLDSLWSKLLPLSAFVNQASSPSSSPIATLPHSLTSSSHWTSLIQALPRPPISLGAASGIVPISPSKLSLSAWPRDYLPRQITSVVILTLIGIHVLYFLFAWLSYSYIFNHDMMKHPKFLKNQVKLEIQCSMSAFPAMTVLTLPWFIAEVRGHSMLYDNVSDYGWTYLVLSVPM